jgi:hypothetical protein
VVGDASPQLGRVAGVEVAVLDASEDVDVVHVLVSDGGWNHCWGAGGLLASASRAAGPLKSALRAGPRGSRKTVPRLRLGGEAGKYETFRGPGRNHIMISLVLQSLR